MVFLYQLAPGTRTIIIQVRIIPYKTIYKTTISKEDVDYLFLTLTLAHWKMDDNFYWNSIIQLSVTIFFFLFFLIFFFTKRVI